MKNSIVICNGHSRMERGCENHFLKLREWQLCYIFAKRLVRVFKRKGFDTYGIYNSVLTQKVKDINFIMPELALEFHMRVSDCKLCGHYCSCWHTSKKGGIYALKISASMSHNVFLCNDVANGLESSDGYFLSKTNCTSIVINLCYIDNDNDLLRTLLNIDAVSKSIYDGFVEGFNYCNDLETGKES